MYGAFDGTRYGRGSATVLTVLLLATPVTAPGQESPPQVTGAPEVRAVVPGQATLEEGAEALRTQLHGTFPLPSHHLLSRLSVTVAARSHSCKMGWSPDLVRSLLDGSGQPWLTQSDLLSEDENDELLRCGSIDGVWADRIELTVHHPSLLAPGALRFGVALAGEPVPRGSASARAPSAESWGEMALSHPLRVLAHTPRSPLARAGEALRLSFVVVGPSLTSAEVSVDGGWTPVSFAVSGERVTIDVPPQLYQAPGLVQIRLSAASGTTQVSIPVCAGDARSGVRCPQS